MIWGNTAAFERCFGDKNVGILVSRTSSWASRASLVEGSFARLGFTTVTLAPNDEKGAHSTEKVFSESLSELWFVLGVPGGADPGRDPGVCGAVGMSAMVEGQWGLIRLRERRLCRMQRMGTLSE